ncbi:MAG: T9SS type A sorting domain-containing protein [Flavipsychrobacter sp.]|nr:T9SS type A sorting domain-containing protein [Flavipsychrobacter sp.]
MFFMKLAFSFLLVLYSVYSTAQTITTVAGTGASTFSGENVPAITAGIPNPGGGVFDKYGNYYFVDAQSSQRVRKITPDGIISTIAGNGLAGFSGDSGPATAARLNGPQGLSIDTSGNIYIADAQNNRIRKVDVSTGIIHTVAGTGVGAYSGDGIPATSANIWNPQDVSVDRLGNIYVADMFNYRIRKVNSSGVISTFAGNGNHGYSGESTLADTSMIGVIVGLCNDTAGNLYMASNTVCRVMKVSTMNIMTTVAGDGSCTFTVDGVAATTAHISPLRCCVDDSENLYIADKYHNRLYKVDWGTGILLTVAGNGIAGDSGDGGAASSATLNGPTGVAVDACGNLLIPTSGNASVPGSGRRIRKVTFNPGGIGTISIAVTPNDTVCAGTVVTFTATTTGASTMGYQWYKNGVAVPGATNATYSYTATTVEGGDSVRCVYTGIDVCSITGNPGSNLLHIVATPLTMPTIAVSSVASATLGSVVTVNATVGSAGGSYSIKWYKNSSLFATTSVPTATYIKGIGTDVITARVSSTAATGCYDTATSSAISIAQDPVQVLQPQATVVVEVYPNPATHSVAVEAGAAIKGITITNAAGQVFDVPQTQVATNRHVLDIAHLPAGVYLLQVTDEYGSKVVKRVVKR